MSQELVLYTQNAPELPEPKKKGWELIGRGKLVMDAELQKHALAQSAILKDYQTMDQPAIEQALKAYKAGYEAIVETRKRFTAHIDNVKEMCMAVEKQYDPKTNEAFKLATARELELRQAAWNAQQAAQNKVTETNMFKTHVINQFHDMAADYRSKLARIVQQTYNTCLEQRTPVENVPTAINAGLAAMREARPKEMQKYGEFKYISLAEAQEIFGTIPQPNYKAIYEEEIKLAKDKFSLYANDLANAEQALKQQQELFDQQQAQQAQQAKAEQAANVLAAQAAALTVAPAGVKGVTETTEIKLQDFDWAWAAKIMSAFLANYKACVAKVKVKKCHSLTIAQMAAALDAASVKVEGIEYQTLQK